MNFAPHHNFSSCGKFEKKIDALRATNAVSQGVLSAYATYHFSLLHKLRATRYHVEALEAFLETQDAQQIEPQALVYRVNFHFDGFLHNIGSALDILAREVLAYYSLPPPNNVYYRTARLEIAAARAGDPILPFLADPPWKREFTEYRNTATHESIIGTEFQVNVSVRENRAFRRLVFPIPNDPRNPALGYNNNPDIVKYCKTTFKRALTLKDRVYAHLHERVKASNVLPL